MVQAVDDDVAPLTKRIPLWTDVRNPHNRIVTRSTQTIGQLLCEDLCPGTSSEQQVGYQNLQYRPLNCKCMLVSKIVLMDQNCQIES